MISQKGQRNANARLNDAMVAHIKRCLLDGICTQVALANRYNVTRHTVSLIWRKRVWQEIEPSESALGPPVKHILKTWPEYYEQVLNGDKTFEVRYCYDRLFQVDDVLALWEWDYIGNDFTGRHMSKRVSYILDGGQFGIASRYCVMGLAKPNAIPSGILAKSEIEG